MNTRDLTSAYLGNTQAAGLYFGDVKLWPLTPPVGYYSRWDGAAITRGDLAGFINGETITYYNTGSAPAYTEFNSSTPYSIYSIEYLGLTTIDDEGANNIADSALYNCTDLTSVVFHNVATIDTFCFLECTSLTSIDIPKCTDIGFGSFQNSPLTYVNVPSCYNVGSDVFAGVTGPGIININSGVTASSGEWLGSGPGQILVDNGWTINYINNG